MLSGRNVGDEHPFQVDEEVQMAVPFILIKTVSIYIKACGPPVGVTGLVTAIT